MRIILVVVALLAATAARAADPEIITLDRLPQANLRMALAAALPDPSDTVSLPREEARAPAASPVVELGTLFSLGLLVCIIAVFLFFRRKRG